MEVFEEEMEVVFKRGNRVGEEKKVNCWPKAWETVESCRWLRLKTLDCLP